MLVPKIDDARETSVCGLRLARPLIEFEEL